MDVPPPPDGPSATLHSSGDPFLDFFFKAVPGTPSATVARLLATAWEKDGLTALKLVCQLRGVRGTGKSDREGFYAAALWLHAHHPMTLARNIESFAEFGYMKDLLEILYRLVDDAHRLAKENRTKSQRLTRRRRLKQRRKRRRSLTRREKITVVFNRTLYEIEAAAKARKLRRKKRDDFAVRAIDRYAGDPHYRFLHDRIAEFFAGLLTSDVEQLKAGRPDKIGLAAKWCPSLDSSYDRATRLCESIARRMFPRDTDPAYQELEEQHYAYRIRDRLRKEVLVPLRKALQLPEVYIGAQQWDSLPYKRFASVAMNNYKKVFMKYDKERFTEYFVDDDLYGRSPAGVVLPHEIITRALSARKNDVVAELLWRRIVRDLRHSSRPRNWMAVCDESGSMKGTPMLACITLGMLISEVSNWPWKKRLIIFSINPKLYEIMGTKLINRINFVKEMKQKRNERMKEEKIKFGKPIEDLFDLILCTAVNEDMAKDEMIERLFVFTDKEFDQEWVSSWETDYEEIRRTFQRSGYEVPEIVFWRVTDCESVPVTAYQKGCALVSGFSPNLLKIFLEMEISDYSNPMAVMDAAIDGEEFSKLEVFD